MPAPTPKNDQLRAMREAKAANAPKPIRTPDDLADEASAISARLKAKHKLHPKIRMDKHAKAMLPEKKKS